MPWLVDAQCQGTCVCRLSLLMQLARNDFQCDQGHGVFGGDRWRLQSSDGGLASCVTFLGATCARRTVTGRCLPMLHEGQARRENTGLTRCLRIGTLWSAPPPRSIRLRHDTPSNADVVDLARSDVQRFKAVDMVKMLILACSKRICVCVGLGRTTRQRRRRREPHH